MPDQGLLATMALAWSAVNATAQSFPEAELYATDPQAIQTAFGRAAQRRLLGSDRPGHRHGRVLEPGLPHRLRGCDRAAIVRSRHLSQGISVMITDPSSLALVRLRLAVAVDAAA